MKYKKLGKLPLDTVEYFKREILSRKIAEVDYQWIFFDEQLNEEFRKIFCNTDLNIQYDPTHNRYVQKAFYSAPGSGFKIHRDGQCCNSALNIAISCNDSDWVRWYDDDLINSLGSIKEYINSGIYKAKSRNVDIAQYEDIPYTHELRNEIGDVYALDVDSLHSFKCNGPEPRIIIQTKFQGYPTFPTILESLERSSFTNII